MTHIFANTSMVEEAQYLAGFFHGEQVDQSGRPYLEHLAYVASQFEDETTQTIAWLHDILEDTMAPYLIIATRFPLVVVRTVVILTRHKDETYMEYIERVSRDRRASEVKWVDLGHNLRPGGTESGKKRYELARTMLATKWPHLK